MKKLILLLLGLSLASMLQAQMSPAPTAYVDPMLGVDGGNVFGGVCLPFSMMRLGPDVHPNNITNGYRSNRPIKGFSHTHLSGTGGGPRYGNFLVIPQVGEVDIEDFVSLKKVNEYSKPGYYQVTLARKPGDVIAKLTATEHVGFHQYEFFKWGKIDSLDANILIDVSHGNTRGKATDHRCTGGDVQVVSDREVSGWASFSGGWGGEAPYTVYFHAEFDTPFAGYGVWEGEALYGAEKQRKNREAIHQELSKFGAYLHFDVKQHQQVQLKVGISFKSEAQAKANIQKEIPHWDFRSVRAAAEQTWNQHLSKIEVKGGTLEDRIKFYSLLHNTLIMPTRVTGQVAGLASDQLQFWEHYTLWDVFRSVMPLHSLILPEQQVAMLNSLLGIYEREGWLPDAWVAGHMVQIQGGTNADVVFADAIAKGLEGFDRKKAYQAMLKNATQVSDQPQKYGRYLEEYARLGYLTPEGAKTGAVSRTVEYAYNDFCISQVAKAMRDKEKHDFLLARSKKMFTLFKQEEGYFWGKDAEGKWLPNFSLEPSRKDHWNDPLFYEGGSGIYSDYAPHAMAELIALHGSEEAYEKHLDEVLSQKFKPSNEQVFLTPYLYQYIAKPSKTAETVRHILNQHYQVGTSGLPGQDDSGAVSSWYVWSAMGLFPVAGQPIYLLGTPIFEEVKLKVAKEKTLLMRVANYAPEHLYIKGLTLNGQQLNRAFLWHHEMVAGGELLIEMAAEPNDTWIQEVPPSY